VSRRLRRHQRDRLGLVGLARGGRGPRLGGRPPLCPAVVAHEVGEAPIGSQTLPELRVVAGGMRPDGVVVGDVLGDGRLAGESMRGKGVPQPRIFRGAWNRFSGVAVGGIGRGGGVGRRGSKVKSLQDGGWPACLASVGARAVAAARHFLGGHQRLRWG